MAAVAVYQRATGPTYPLRGTLALESGGLDYQLRPDVRPNAWAALGLMTVGGLILGPVVQKHAFGAFWTGIPFGYDLTDNKTLLMWMVWLVACAVLSREDRRRVRRARGRAAAHGYASRRASATPPGPTGAAAVLLATVVMLAVYLVGAARPGARPGSRGLTSTSMSPT